MLFQKAVDSAEESDRLAEHYWGFFIIQNFTSQEIKKTCQNSAVRYSSGKKSNFKSSSPKIIQDFNRWLALLGNTRRASGKKEIMHIIIYTKVTGDESIRHSCFSYFQDSSPLNISTEWNTSSTLQSYAAWTLHPSFPCSRPDVPWLEITLKSL